MRDLSDGEAAGACCFVLFLLIVALTVAGLTWAVISWIRSAA